MSKRISLILSIVSLVLISGCNALKIPEYYRFSPSNLKNETSGHWIRVNLTKQTSSQNSMPLSGELISIRSDTLSLLSGSGFADIPIEQIKSAILYIYIYPAGKFAIVTGLVASPNIIASICYQQFGFLVLGIPWMITGTIISLSNGPDNLSTLNYPYNCDLNDLKKYARYPQGIPQGIDRSLLHLR